ncbi:MAG: TonB-dependent receptor domain-containing protein [Melioribacteraceae bacterium]
MHRKIFYFLLFLVLCPVLINAGTKGRIKGKVVDLQTGEALIGANVVVVGSSAGSNTDVNGEYLIQNLDPGVYTLRASYVGYQTITYSNVRVSADLTAYQNFELPSQDIQVGTVLITATKPIIQKDNTNAVRITTNEDIDALPVRGVNAILGLTAGVTLQNNTVYIRGGRPDEVGYYLEGVSTKNPVSGGNAVTLSQDALEEIQVQAGGYTAEFGGSNAGIVRTQFKSGGPEWKASVEYITDNVGFSSKKNAFDGTKRLGAYWWGYDETSAVLSGPLFNNKFKFFGNIDYQYNRDNNPQPFPGINLGILGDPTSLDTVNMMYPAGARKGRQTQRYSYVGTLNMDFKPILVRLSGTYTTGQNELSGGLGNMFQTRQAYANNNNGAFNVKITHVLSQTMFYEISAGYYLTNARNFTPGVSESIDQIWTYGDSVAQAAAGYPVPRGAYDAERNKTGRYVAPSLINIMGFGFNRDGSANQGFAISNQRSLSLAGNLSFSLGKTHMFKLGGDYQSFTIRNWGANSQYDLAGQLNTFNTNHPNASAADLEAFKTQTLVTLGVNNYGYDYLGNEVNDGIFGPRKPVFASAYIQDRIEYEDIIINAGLRFDYFNVDQKTFVDPTFPEKSFSSATGQLIEAGWKDIPTYSGVSPRIGFSFPVTDRTVFHAQWGKFVQLPQLNTLYLGYAMQGWRLKGGFFITTPIALELKPTRTTQYELGFTQQFTDFMSIDITGFYKDIADQIQSGQQVTDRNSSIQAYNILFNSDFATTKGVEISLTMRRYERLAINANISFQDAQGTGSNTASNLGFFGSGAPSDPDGAPYVPKYISPLSFNQYLRGSVNIDYRFGDNDGGPILQNLGVSVSGTFNGGHPYTLGTGGRNAETDGRDRIPLESLNSSTTPSAFQVDLRVDKTFKLFDKMNLNVYVFVINLFDIKNVENVFLRTGTATDDGVMSNPSFSGKLLATYGQAYADLYNAINLDYQGGYGGPGNLYNPPRQIRLGVRLEY